MKKLLFVFMLMIAPVSSRAQDMLPGSGTGPVRALTFEGGPVFSRHFQTSDVNFRERHGLGVVKVETANHGTWGLYVLSPNSVRNTSIGAGYVSHPYIVPLGPTEMELSGALGLVTGYQDYPVPLLAGQARLRLYEDGALNAGLAVAALPYFMKDDTTGDNEFGIVATTPFLSVRYRFY